MARHTQASSDQAASYRRETTIRVAAWSAATVVSAAAGLGAAALITSFFPGSNGDTRNNIFGYSFLAVFAIVCSIAVYMIDRTFTRKFNQNP